MCRNIYKFNLYNLGECYNPDLSSSQLLPSDNIIKFGKARVQEVNLFSDKFNYAKSGRYQSDVYISLIKLSLKQSYFRFLSQEMLVISDIQLHQAQFSQISEE
ncbi:Hypothetical_protein [Hexamita inflata]|uniref:Hypothetical_protein n=1 Tax=Hexamita inflata TaxID=28002 RepID=A0ABP1HQA0_9EUKA